MSIPASIRSFVDELADNAPTAYDDLRAVVFNGSLKRSPEPSHTDGLLDVAAGTMRRLGVRVDVVRTADHEIPPGVWPDMREQGYARDDFPALYQDLVVPADIVVLAGPIWLGDQSSLTRKIIERLYAYSGDLNDRGQWSYYGKVGGALTTGNEDGGKHVSAQILYALQHIGLAIPPQSDAYWVGEAGTGTVLPRRRRRRRGQRVDDAQHRLHDLEPAAPRADAQGRGRHPGPRERGGGLGPRGCPRIPIRSTAAEPLGCGCLARSARGTIAAP